MRKTKIICWSLSTLAVTALASVLHAQDANLPVVTAHSHRVTATVKALDPATRQITLDTPRGVISFQVDPSVERLDNVHAGDKVIVNYYQGIAAQLAKGDKKVADPAGTTFAYKSPGGKPGGGAGQSVTATVTILAINSTTHTAVFKNSDGTVDSVDVQAPQMQEFLKTLKPGDSVDVTYTESVAISVAPAKSN
jgi:hypothetical protein